MTKNGNNKGDKLYNFQKMTNRNTNQIFQNRLDVLYKRLLDNDPSEQHGMFKSNNI